MEIGTRQFFLPADRKLYPLCAYPPHPYRSRHHSTKYHYRFLGASNLPLADSRESPSQSTERLPWTEVSLFDKLQNTLPAKSMVRKCIYCAVPVMAFIPATLSRSRTHLDVSRLC